MDFALHTYTFFTIRFVYILNRKYERSENFLDVLMKGTNYCDCGYIAVI
jgi:hypothetical protein